MAMTAKNKFRLAILCFQLVKYLRTITLEIYGYLWQNDVPSYLILPFIFTLRALSCSDSGGGVGGGDFYLSGIQEISTGKAGEVGSGLLNKTSFCPRTPPLLKIKPGSLQARVSSLLLKQGA